jgi:glyoxylase-like metal-dependent hydrolase (beta-lactamase superfamily II)
MNITIFRNINTIYASNTYLIYNQVYNGVWIVDPGDYFFIEKFVETRKCQIEGILLTHLHIDHIYGLQELLKQYPDLLIVGHKICMEGIAVSGQNLSKYAEIEFRINNPTNKLIVTHNDALELWRQCVMKIYETPGHEISCVSYYLDKFLFTGDAFIPGVKTVTNLPKGNKADAQKSREFIYSFFPPDTLIYPGHKDACLLQDIQQI